MNAALGLLALVLIGADGPPRPVGSPLVYQLHIYEMNGVGWRQSFREQLQPVTRQGSASLWTTSRKTARDLAAQADHVVQAPRLTALSEAPAHVALNPPSPYRNSSEWRARVASRNESVDLASFEPALSASKGARPKFAATFTGRKLDQGVLTKLVLENTSVLAVHTATAPGDDRQPPIEVPEVVQSDVTGEWLIPTGGALVIGLGIHTVADKDGKAEVRERLVVLEAQPSPSLALNPAAAIDRRLNQSLGIARTAVERPSTALPMPVPVAPSRSLPQGRKSDGTPAELPPLPPEVDTPTAMPNSSEPCASPQTRREPASKELTLALNLNELLARALPPAPEAKEVRVKHAFPKSAIVIVGPLAGQIVDLTRVPLVPGLPTDVPTFGLGPDIPWANTQAVTQRASMRATGFETAAGAKISEHVKPVEFRIPWNGATIEVRVTPHPRPSPASPTDDGPDDGCECCEKAPAK